MTGDGDSRPTRQSTPLHAISVDVEEHYQVAAFDGVLPRTDWPRQESRVRANTERLLNLFADMGVRGTFFVLGNVAERDPELVPAIARMGHEIACHGWSHTRITDQDRTTFREETRRAKALLEDQAGVAVHGYRAATFSVVERTRWAIDELAAAGFTYDSSIVPARHDRYGIPDAPLRPYRVQGMDGAQMAEFPITVLPLAGGLRLPVGGGGYFRLYPYAFTRWALSRVGKDRPVVFYLHPWEVDPEQPRIQAGWLSRFRHYNNLERCLPRLVRLLTDFSFTTCRQVLEQSGVLAEVADAAQSTSLRADAPASSHSAA